MSIIETKIDYPIAILNEERYNYYLDCEKKSNIKDDEIREEALRMYKEWVQNTDLKVDITMKTLRGTLYRSEASFYAEWYRGRRWGAKEMECPSFIFNQSLNDAVNAFVSEAYKEHREELEKELYDSVNRRQKSYVRMRKMVITQWVVIAVLLSLIFII